MSNNSVLIVEDDKDIRNTLSLALELEGYEVLEAENGRKALDTLLSLPEGSLPGCIILDLMMPVMDGMSLLDEIYKNFNLRLGSIPVILASAYGEVLDLRLTPVIAANISKPFTLDQLYKIVGQFCTSQKFA